MEGRLCCLPELSLGNSNELRPGGVLVCVTSALDVSPVDLASNMRQHSRI